MPHPNSVLRCYRLTHQCSYDEEVIWAYVQRSGGHLSIRGDCIDYWVPPRAELFLILTWPDLERRDDLDLLDHRRPL
jgi:hypothetical protein